jgi:hypothetical protein
MQHHKYNLSDIENMVPWEKSIYVTMLINFIKEHNIRSVVDAACGDWQSSHLIYDQLENIEYDGYDIVKFLMEENKIKYPKYNFHHLNFYEYPENLKSADLLILKDVIQHWSTRQIVSFLDRLLSLNQYKYILICNSSNQKYDYSIDDITDQPLSCNYFPLKQYGGKVVYKYNDKEVSIIECK